MKNFFSLAVSRMAALAARKTTRSGLQALAVFLLLTFASSAGWAQGTQGLQTKPCPVSGGGTVQAYYCLDDIIAVDGSGYNSSGTSKVGGLYLVDPISGNQTPISTGGYLGQAASVTLEPGTGKILASSRTYGVVRVDPKDGSQEVLLKGGTGWGTGYPTFLDSASNVTKTFVYSGGITIDPMDNSILVTDTGIDLTSALCTPNNVTTCARFPGRIIRIKKGLGAGVYAGTAVVSEAGSLVAPFDLAVDGGSSLYVTDMNAKLGGTNDPGMGGIIYLNASNSYAQSPFFSSYNSASPSSAGCPMGITINATGAIFATVFSYNGFGCSPQAVFKLQPDPYGVNPPTFNVVVAAASGSPGYPSLQFPFGMDTDRSGNVIIADEGSGYGCGGTIFRLNPASTIVTTANGLWNGAIPGNLNPLAISPMVGLGCTPPGQAFLVPPTIRPASTQQDPPRPSCQRKNCACEKGQNLRHLLR